MKITYLRLKNFSTIESGMNKKSIEIDFTKCKNNIILLVGGNGTGKTSLFSSLHPFAYPGNMDVRSNSTMILEGHDGEKEIHYSNGLNEYVIMHYYKNTKKGLTVKSFISKNGTELNPNGNVTSFNEIVNVELGILPEHMKLIRLGSNVTNLIDMKAVDRKNAVSILFSELDVWSELYKKVNEDNRMLKSLINTVASKLQKLNINDLEDVTNNIKMINIDILHAKKNLDELTKRLGVIEGSINTLIPEGISAFKDNLSNIKAKYKSIQNDISKLYNKINSFNIILTDDIDKHISEVNKSIDKVSNDIDVKDTLLKEYNDRLNDYMNQLDDCNKQLATMTSSDEKESLEDLIKTLNKKLKSFPDYGDFKMHMSKDALMLSINVLTEIDRQVSILYEFGYDVVDKCIALIMERVDINQYVSKEVDKIDKKIIDITSQFKANNTLKDDIILYRPPDCMDDTCPYLDIYERFFKPKDVTNESVSSLETKRESLLALKDVASNIDYIIRIINANKSLSDGLLKYNINYLTFDHISYAIIKRLPIYDERIITDIIADIEDYEEYEKTKSQLQTLSLEYANVKINDNLLDSLNKDKSSLNEKIHDTDIKISGLQKEIKHLKSNKDILSQHLSDSLEYKELNDSLHELIDAGDKLSDVIKEKESILESISAKIEDISMIREQIISHQNKIRDLDNRLFNEKYREREYITLTKEKELLADRYEEISITKEALSSTKGAPLLFIQLYLQSSTIFINKILNSVCDNFEIAGFNITESEFNIPYIKNGIEISDITHASQGERTFLSLALSYALIQNSIKDYNIMLLDEIDSTLDTKNRAIFLNILLHLMELGDSEQMFLITHNNMFDSYPVDVIMTSDISLDNYKNANIIFKA